MMDAVMLAALICCFGLVKSCLQISAKARWTGRENWRRGPDVGRKRI